MDVAVEVEKPKKYVPTNDVRVKDATGKEHVFTYTEWSQSGLVNSMVMIMLGQGVKETEIVVPLPNCTTEHIEAFKAFYANPDLHAKEADDKKVFRELSEKQLEKNPEPNMKEIVSNVEAANYLGNIRWKMYCQMPLAVYLKKKAEGGVCAWWKEMYRKKYDEEPTEAAFEMACRSSSWISELKPPLEYVKDPPRAKT